MNWDAVYFYYFVIHTPITLLMDSTFVIPHEYQLSIQSKLSEFHIKQNQDFIAIEKPLWIQIFVVWELIFQLPFFIYGIMDYLKNNKTGYSVHSWPMFLLYGFNAGFTSLVCLIYILSEGPTHGLSTGSLINLFSLYVPTTLLPFYMMYDFYHRIGKLLKEDKPKVL
ncbi:unnamed protein product [Pichia kudriavzevii]